MLLPFLISDLENNMENLKEIWKKCFHLIRKFYILAHSSEEENCLGKEVKCLWNDLVKFSPGDYLDWWHPTTTNHFLLSPESNWRDLVDDDSDMQWWFNSWYVRHPSSNGRGTVFYHCIGMHTHCAWDCVCVDTVCWVSFFFSFTCLGRLPQLGGVAMETKISTMITFMVCLLSV